MIDDAMTRAATRVKVHKGVEFYVDADIIKADSIDVSKTGIKFKTDAPIKIRMRLETDENTLEERVAELVWAQKESDGLTTYGLHFLDNVVDESNLCEEKSESFSGEW